MSIPAFGSRQRGFTLIELLVTIVILGFVIGVMSGAFSQVAQILRVAAESGNGFQERWLRMRALQDLVANLVRDDDPDSRLTGTATRFECLTLASPLSEAGMPRRMQVALEPAAGADGQAGTDLLIRALDPAPGDDGKAPPKAAVRWTHWAGKLRFGYIDRAGKEHDAWPPTEARRDELPSEVLVRPEDSDKVLVRSAVFEGPLYKPASANMNALRDFLGFER